MKVIQQLLKLRELTPRNIRRYKQLAEWYHKLNQPEFQERALTSIIEALPEESESHQMLAEIRQREKRWDETVPHWREVIRIRSLEPTGYLRLAETYLHLKEYAKVSRLCKQVLDKKWPARFSNAHRQARMLIKQIK